ncbi:MAG TPA: transposase [Anaerolineae bacterium]|nr:transposase [Anaerolineae bacterium]
MLLFIDQKTVNEVPPLRAMWAPIGTQARVPIVAAHDVRVLNCVLSIQSGDAVLHLSERYRSADFQAILHLVRSHWRGWHIVLFLDKHPAQWAVASRQLARQLGIQLWWLPAASPELNVVDQLWRRVIDKALANEPTPTLQATVERLMQHIRDMRPQERRRQAGILSDSFWLAKLLK